MDNKKIEKDGFNLHLIKDTNYKTIYINIIFGSLIDKKDITYSNLLFKNLLFSTKKYNSPRKIAIRKEDLYGLSLSYHKVRKSNYLLNELSLSFPLDKYTEDGLLKDSIDFLMETLSNPNVSNGKFDDEIFNITKNMLKEEIKSEMEDPSSFAMKNYFDIIGSSNPYNYSLYGTLDDLDSITSTDLYNFYKSYFSKCNIDIIVTGDIDFDLINSLFDSFPFKGIRNYTSDLYLDYSKKYTLNIIKSDYNQSKLIMGASCKDFSLYEKKYVSIFYNIIFGNSPNSKLFLNVREKKSLCYSINSIFNRLDGLFMIYAGISKSNFKLALDEINKCISDMKKGLFNDDDIDDARVFIKSVIEESFDYQSSICERYFNNLYFDLDDKDKQLKMIDKVTKEEICEFANKINIDTILLVEERYERDKNK